MISSQMQMTARQVEFHSQRTSLKSLPVLLRSLISGSRQCRKWLFQHSRLLFASSRGHREYGISTPLPDFIGGNSIKLLVNGNEILPAILGAINAAQHTIRWLVMVFQPDNAGRQLADALISAAHRGVQVQLAFNIDRSVYGFLVDPFPRGKVLQHKHDMTIMLQALQDAGVKIFNNASGTGPSPVALNEKLWIPQTDLARLGCVFIERYDHRKLLILDDNLAIVGGANVCNEELYHIAPDVSQDMAEEALERQSRGLPEPWGKWQDVAVRVEGPIVASLMQELNWGWGVLGGDSPAVSANFPTLSDCRIQVLSQGPGRREIGNSYLSLIERAEKGIFVVNPYITYDMALKALMRAGNRGVRVVLLFPARHNNVVFSRRLFRSRIGRLLSANIEVRENNLRMSHAKAMVVDGRWVSLGSFNLNHRSFDHDLELNIVIDDRAFARDVMSRVFDIGLKNATCVTAAYSTRWNPLDWLLRRFI